MGAGIWGNTGVLNANVQGTIKPQSFTAIDGQTDFVITAFTYTINSGSLWVIVNGDFQTPGSDFSELTSTAFRLATPCVAGDIVLVIGFPVVTLTQPQGTGVYATTTTGSVITPSGGTAQRDAAPLEGYFRFNSTLKRLESYLSAALGWCQDVVQTGLTGSAILPAGTTAQRDPAPAAGWTRFNTTLDALETFNGTAWEASAKSTGQTGSIVAPIGTTAQRDASPQPGYVRVNSETGSLEIYVNATEGWKQQVVSQYEFYNFV